MEKKNIKGMIFGILLLVLSLVLCIGVKTVFSACASMDNGMYMNCHKAENISAIIGGVLAVISAVSIFVSAKGVRIAAAVITAAGAVTAAVLPNNVIKLCMMDTMHCHAVMRPFVMVMSIIIAVCAVVSIIVNAVGGKD